MKEIDILLHHENSIEASPGIRLRLPARWDEAEHLLSYEEPASMVESSRACEVFWKRGPGYALHLLRQGEHHMDLLLNEEGQVEHFIYETPYGRVPLQLEDVHFCWEQDEIELSYRLMNGSEEIGEFTIHIQLMGLA